MENKNKIEIGYLEVNSWEHFSLTHSRSTSDVAQLKWILPAETNEFLDKFLNLWQETLLQDCTPLSPLKDGRNKERIVYVKSKSFKKRLKNESIVFLKKLPLGMLMFKATGDPIGGAGQIFFPNYVEHLKFSDLISNWDDYVFENTGYAPGFFSNVQGNKFWVPKSDEKIIDHYNVKWRQHYFEDKIIENIFNNDVS